MIAIADGGLRSFFGGFLATRRHTKSPIQFQIEIALQYYCFRSHLLNSYCMYSIIHAVPFRAFDNLLLPFLMRDFLSWRFVYGDEETTAAPRAFCSFHTDICMRHLIRTVHNPLVIHQFQNVKRGIKYKTYVAIQSRVRHLSNGHEWRFQMFLVDALDTYLVGRQRDLLCVEQTMKTKYEKMCSQVYNCD